LKENVGQSLLYNETSFFGTEYKPTGKLTVADHSTQRKWFATVEMKDGLIVKVS
jgi:hypothetical protein